MFVGYVMQGELFVTNNELFIIKYLYIYDTIYLYCLYTDLEKNKHFTVKFYYKWESSLRKKSNYKKAKK